MRLSHFERLQRFGRFEVGERPHFETMSAVQVFARQLSLCQCYFEYGSGGSTVMAAKTHRPFFSVESDRWYHNAVARKIGRRPPGFIHANIGPTGAWGIPEPRETSLGQRLRQFDGYSNLRKHLGQSGLFPDFILIDGRFRLACALKFIRAAQQDDRDWVMAFDDFGNRRYYHALLLFAEPREQHGNFVLFGPRKGAVDLDALNRLIDDCRFDWR